MSAGKASTRGAGNDCDSRRQCAATLGISTGDCERAIDGILATFPLVNDTPALFDEWRSLVTAHGCIGKIAHDARIAAALQTHGLTHLLTFNVGDFARFPGITILDPKVIAASVPVP